MNNLKYIQKFELKIGVFDRLTHNLCPMNLVCVCESTLYSVQCCQTNNLAKIHLTPSTFFTFRNRKRIKLNVL